MLVIVLLVSGLSLLFGQSTNQELDILGKPFKAGITVLPPENTELVPWLDVDQFTAVINNALKRTPGVETIMMEKETVQFRAMYKNGDLPHYIKVSGRQYLLRMVVEDGGIIYRHTPEGKRDKEINRYLNARVSIINVATSRIELVARLHAEAKDKKKEAAAAKLKNPRVNQNTWPLYESLSAEVSKKIAPFFSHPTPIIKFVDGKGRYLNGVKVPGAGSRPKIMPKQIDIFRIESVLETEYGNFYEFDRISVGSIVKKTDFWSEVTYTIGWGKKKILKEIEEGGTVYNCKDLDELR